MRAVMPALLLALAACGQPADTRGEGIPPNDAARARVSHDLGPFFRAETAMDDAMRGAVGTSAADTWVRMMLAHHQGEVAMAQVLLEQDPSPRAAELARRTIAVRPGEITALERLTVAGEGDYEAARVFEPALARMHEAMMGVQDADVSTGWARKMLHHHRGGVAITDILLKRSDVPEDVRRAAETAKAGQTEAIEALHARLPSARTLLEGEGLRQ